MRREEFYEGVVRFFGFTQISGVAVSECADVSVAERTDLSAREDVPATAAAKHQFLLLLFLFCFRARGSYLNQIIRERKFVDGFRRSIRILEDQLEPAMIERSAGRLFNLRDPFAQSLLRQLERAMVAVRIVPGADSTCAILSRSPCFDNSSVR